jgi:hypothetical protein
MFNFGKSFEMMAWAVFMLIIPGALMANGAPLAGIILAVTAYFGFPMLARRMHSQQYIDAALADPYHRNNVVNAIGPKYLAIMDRHFRGEPVDGGELDDARVVAVTAERSVAFGVIAALHKKGYASKSQVAAATTGVLEATAEMDRRGLELSKV